MKEGSVETTWQWPGSVGGDALLTGRVRPVVVPHIGVKPLL